METLKLSPITLLYLDKKLHETEEINLFIENGEIPYKLEIYGCNGSCSGNCSGNCSGACSGACSSCCTGVCFL